MIMYLLNVIVNYSILLLWSDSQLKELLKVLTPFIPNFYSEADRQGICVLNLCDEV